MPSGDFSTLFFDNTPVYTPRQFPTVPYEEGKDLDAGMNPLWDDSSASHPVLENGGPEGNGTQV